MTLDARNVTLRRRVPVEWRADYPVIIALHGGTYTSEYYDIMEHSLLDRAAALGFHTVAIDRPGYGETIVLSPDELAHEGNSQAIERIIGDYWDAEGAGTPGIVLIGHSIGGAIAAAIASRHPSWPLLGIAVSGLGLRHQEGNAGELRDLAGGSHVNMSPPFKDSKMFGPDGSYFPATPGYSRTADSPAPLQDIMDVVRTWPGAAHALLGRVEVPIHYRQAEYDGFWSVSDVELEAFRRACAASSWIDAGIFRNSGHCIDLHRVGPAFQLEQLAFALKCAVAANC